MKPNFKQIIDKAGDAAHFLTPRQAEACFNALADYVKELSAKSDERYVSLAEIAALTGMSQSWVCHTVPYLVDDIKRIPISKKVARYNLGDVKKYIATKGINKRRRLK